MRRQSILLALVIALVATALPALAQERHRFDDDFYLYNNPDVADAVRQGHFRNGFEHYERYGREEGRAPAFDEQFYLQTYPDVAEAVRRGTFRSGWEHFQRYGRNEGRAGGPGTRARIDRERFERFDESFYLYNNPDVAEAVRRGTFRSGREHYDRYGRAEDRDTTFNPRFYLRVYPDVARALRRGRFSDPYDHFRQVGMREGRAGGRGTRQPNWNRERGRDRDRDQDWHDRDQDRDHDHDRDHDSH